MNIFYLNILEIDRNMKIFCTLVLVSALLLSSCSDSVKTRTDNAPLTQSEMTAEQFNLISPITNELIKEYGLDPNYHHKVITVWGIPVIGPKGLDDTLLRNAAEIVAYQLSDSVLNSEISVEIRNKLYQRFFSVVIFPETGQQSGSESVPGFTHLSSGPGYSATKDKPTMVATETSVDYPTPSDKNYYSTEEYGHSAGNSLIHELTHSIHLLALRDVFPSFDKELKSAYKNMRSNRLWSDSGIQYVVNDGMGYIAQNEVEYLAVGSELWNNVRSIEAKITREKDISLHQHLKQNDPQLYKILSQFYNSKNLINPSVSIYKPSYIYTCPINYTDLNTNHAVSSTNGSYNDGDFTYTLFIDGNDFSFSLLSNPQKRERKNREFLSITHVPGEYTAKDVINLNLSLPHPEKSSSFYFGDNYRVEFYFNDTYLTECSTNRTDIVNHSLTEH